jgi:uncharacterized protein
LLYWLRRAESTLIARRVTQALIAAGADPNFAGVDGQSPRALALRTQDADLVELLSWPPNSHPKRPLIDSDCADAARRGDVVTLRRLLRLGLNPEACDRDGGNALAHAAGRADLALLELLLEHGASPNVEPDSGAQPPIHCALRVRAYPILQRLLKAGADAQISVQGLSASALACAMMDSHALNTLLQHDRSLARSAPGQTPPLHALMLALCAALHQLEGEEREQSQECDALVRHAEPLFEQLLDAGADVHSRDPEQRNLVLLIAGAGQNQVVIWSAAQAQALMALLLRLGADVQARDGLERNALHWCCKHRQIALARVLVAAGTDPHSQDALRRAPVDMAQAIDKHDFLAIFRGEE